MNLEIRKNPQPSGNKNIKDKKKLPVSTVILTLVAMFLVFSAVILNIKTEEATAQLNEINEEIKSLDAQQKELESQIEEKLPAEQAIKIAEEEYGMVKAEELPQVYVSVPRQDKGEVIEKPEEEGTLRTLFSAVGKGLSVILEYMQG